MPPPPLVEPSKSSKTKKDSHQCHLSPCSSVGSSCSKSLLDSKKVKSADSNDGFETVQRSSQKKPGKNNGEKDKEVEQEDADWYDDDHRHFCVAPSFLSTPLSRDPTSKTECNQHSSQSLSAIVHRAERNRATLDL